MKYDDAEKLIKTGNVYNIFFDVYDHNGNKETLEGDVESPSNARYYLYALQSNYKSTSYMNNRGFAADIDKHEFVNSHSLIKDTMCCMDIAKKYEVPYKEREKLDALTVAIRDFKAFRIMTETLFIEGVSEMTFHLVEKS